jgi:hypothetical protein
MLGTCSLGAENLNHWMVEQGWALAYLKYSLAYVRAEQAARTNQRGLWHYCPLGLAPSKPTDRDSRSAQGATRCAETFVSPTSTEGAPSPECNIKGNISRKGERIYHVPGQYHYPTIEMNKRDGRRWFNAKLAQTNPEQMDGDMIINAALLVAISSFAIAPLVIYHQSNTCERVGILTNAHRIMTL